MNQRYLMSVPIGGGNEGAIGLCSFLGSRKLFDDLGYEWECLGQQGSLRIYYSATREGLGFASFLAFFDVGTNLSEKNT